MLLRFINFEFNNYLVEVSWICTNLILLLFRPEKMKNLIQHSLQLKNVSRIRWSFVFCPELESQCEQNSELSWSQLLLSSEFWSHCDSNSGQNTNDHQILFTFLSCRECWIKFFIFFGQKKEVFGAYSTVFLSRILLTL